jgi:hypothetical protein
MKVAESNLKIDKKQIMDFYNQVRKQVDQSEKIAIKDARKLYAYKIKDCQDMLVQVDRNTRVLEETTFKIGEHKPRIDTLIDDIENMIK